MLRRTRIVRSCAITAGCAVLATLSPFASPARQALANPPPPVSSDPISLAAAYIGTPTSTLAADIVNETMRTGLPGTQVAIDQLDAAMTRQLSALAPTTDSSTIMAYRSLVVAHDTIRDQLLDRTLTALKGALGG
jgi:hypothetical protein